ncbi:uncharacterized protein PHALS_02365 [Plasmopara halstedii]|uniref:Uncharacterized protein n=1 Tax=Plasmopara halstedii TaxID=4781 RepID=A0A0P1AXT3_PLAHL|nr:uncharacterized protein PHALS_02365 [Plasmopara halstedii]CEG46042.1 hypothetical protein PHALS_02365 [Plasmopara halstedii]|eukprot:XP_024582411.1 hypothetical protein PHALS_02365 [Plasmopara halstedii]
MTSIAVTYRTTLDGELRAFMIAQLIKYLLFMRGQIPCLYDELVKVVQRNQEEVGQKLRRQRLPSSGSLKKAIKCVEASELLLSEQINAVFSLQVQKMVLVFGPSLISPREVVILEFKEPNTMVEEDKATSCSMIHSPVSSCEALNLSPTRSRAKLMQMCTKKLMRAVFTQAMEQFTSPLSATKLHIAVLAERQAARIPGFLPKQNFKLRLPKKKRAYNIVITDRVDRTKMDDQFGVNQDQSNRTSNGQSQSPFIAPPHNLEFMWYVLEKPVPGFSDVITTDSKRQRNLR